MIFNETDSGPDWSDTTAWRYPANAGDYTDN